MGAISLRQVMLWGGVLIGLIAASIEVMNEPTADLNFLGGLFLGTFLASGLIGAAGISLCFIVFKIAIRTIGSVGKLLARWRHRKLDVGKY